MNENLIADWLSKIEMAIREGTATREREAAALVNAIERLTKELKRIER